jgi:hypothetical protein
MPSDLRSAAARARLRLATGGSSAIALVGTLLVPKCPLCVAAWLPAIGLGVTGATWLAPILRIGGFAIAAIGATLLVTLEWRRRRSAATQPAVTRPSPASGIDGPAWCGRRARCASTTAFDREMTSRSSNHAAPR